MSNVHHALEAASESAVMHFGINAQMVKSCEEMGELIVQLCKRLNGSPTTTEAIVDEVADVLVMVSQMRFVFGAAEVDQRILYKLDRIMNRIREVKSNVHG